MKRNSPALIIFSVCLFSLVCGCALPPIDPVSTKVKIVPQSSLTDEFLSCFIKASSLGPEQLLLEKEKFTKTFLETSSRENRVCLACLCVAEGSPSSLQYGLRLLTELQEEDIVENSELSGLTDLVGRILALKKVLNQQQRSLEKNNARIVSLEEKLEKLKNIEKIISDREKETQGRIN